MKHKAILERPLKRREQHDWNLDAEIVALGHRIGLGALDPAEVRVLLTTDELAPSLAIAQLVRSTLDENLSVLAFWSMMSRLRQNSQFCSNGHLTSRATRHRRLSIYYLPSYLPRTI